MGQTETEWINLLPKGTLREGADLCDEESKFASWSPFANFVIGTQSFSSGIDYMI